MDRDILLKIQSAVRAGQFDMVLRFDVGKSPPKDLKKSIMYLENLKNWHFDGFYIIHATGIPMPAIASWKGRIGIQLQDHEYRYHLLALDRGGKRVIYSIPFTELDRMKSLPGIDLDPAEFKLLIEMADDLYDAKQDEEVLIRNKKPAKDDVLRNVEYWKTLSYDETELLGLLEREPLLLSILTAAVDAQLRAIKRCKRAPTVLYNYILDAKDSQAASGILSTLRTVTFSTSSTSLSCGPIDLQIKETSDIAAWRKSPGRLVILRTATGSLLRPIFDDLEERDRIEKCGGLLPGPLPSIPVVISKSLLHNRFAVDVEIPKYFSPLTSTEAMFLRAAAARLITRPFVESLYRIWQHTMKKPDAFFWDSPKIWSRILSLKIIDILFREPELHERAEALVLAEADRQAEIEAARQEILNRAINLLTCPDQYAREIIDRPATKVDAERMLSCEAVAFRFCPAKGTDRGKKFLAFSKPSLLRLLSRVSLPETAYEAFLAECEKNGILGKNNWPINLGGETFNAVTFFVK